MTEAEISLKQSYAVRDAAYAALGAVIDADPASLQLDETGFLRPTQVNGTSVASAEMELATAEIARADAVIALKGENATSDVVTELAFGAYNKLFAPNRTKVDWLSADESNVDDYIADPLCGADATVGLFRQMLHGIRFNQRQSHLRQMDREMPVLFVAGDKDPVGNCGKGVRQTYDAFRAAGMRDCTLKLYPGLRHEILNEKTYAADITKDIEAWLLSRLEK